MPPVEIRPRPTDQLRQILQDACEEGAVEEVRSILTETPRAKPPGLESVDVLSYALKQGLRIAAEIGDVERLRHLLGRWRTDSLGLPEIKGMEFEEALIAAVEHRHVDVVRYLLNHKGVQVTPRLIRAPANFRRIHDNDVAVTGAILQAFLDHGWDINSRSDTGAPLIWYVRPFFFWCIVGIYYPNTSLMQPCNRQPSHPELAHYPRRGS
jgi:hypothetical protein